MNATKLIGIVLIALGLAAAYAGINKISDNTKEVNLLGVKISASNESGKTEGILYLGIGIVLVVGGIFSLNRKGN